MLEDPKEKYATIPSEQDIIKTDEDTYAADVVDGGSLYPYDPTKADVDIREDHQTVFELVRKYNRGKLVLNPDFQRHLVWKPVQKSRFIESILLNFPLPPFYLNKTVEGKFIVVDGLQRTTTLYSFLEDQFKLTGLQALPKYNGLKFSELPEKYQTKIEDKKLFIYIIMPSVPLQVVYDIFNRINTGGTQLQRQEIRNCIYIGASTRLLKKLSEKDYFRKAIDNGISPKRMKDREAILRYLAFQIQDYQSLYKGDMSEFLEQAMVKINLMSEEELLKLEELFERVMRCTYDFFGNKNFRLPDPGGRGRVNIALLESVAYFFAHQTDTFLHENKAQIVNNFSKLIEDQEYIDAIRFATGNTKKVVKRMEKVAEILGGDVIETKAEILNHSF